MVKLILERIIVFGLIFSLGFAISSKEGKNYQNNEQNFKNDLTQLMNKYNYVETDKSIWDYRFIKGNNEITYEVTINPQKVKVKKIKIKINFTNLDEIYDDYNVLKEIYSDDVVDFQKETDKLYTEFENTGEKQSFQDLNSKRQIAIWIKKSEDKENVIELNCHITLF